MEPYYKDDKAGIVIYHGDCREVLPGISNCDVVLTDPPYGLGKLWAGGGGEHTRSSWRFDPTEVMSWDGTTVPDIVERLHEYASCVIIWGGNFYRLPPTRCWFLWDKKQNDEWTTGQAEMAWTNVLRPIRVFRLSQAEAHGEMETKLHPTQKPLSLFKWCLMMSRVQGDRVKVLDPFMGSGTALRAAKDLGMHAIGIEIEERYCEIAANRLRQEVWF